MLTYYTGLCNYKSVSRSSDARKYASASGSGNKVIASRSRCASYVIRHSFSRFAQGRRTV
jgi:hypothetical protein